MEHTSPDSPKIILGDINHCEQPLSDMFSSYCRCVHDAMRGNNVLDDQCLCSVPDSYKTIIRPGIGNSDHNVVHLLPKYKQMLKTVKPVRKEVKAWNESNVQSLKACLADTDWEVFDEENINLSCDVINDYIQFCVNMHVPTKCIKLYPNQKPWISKELRNLLKEKQIAFREGNAESLAKSKKAVSRGIKEAKNKYKDKLQSYFSTNNSMNAWKCLNEMTGRAKRKNDPFLFSSNPFETANDLNRFFCRFESDEFREQWITQELQLSELAGVPITVHLWEVEKLLKRVNQRKACGPDHITGKILKTCAHELAVPFCSLIRRSLNTHDIPVCWKSAVVVPVAKKPRPAEFNDIAGYEVL